MTKPYILTLAITLLWLLFIPSTFCQSADSTTLDTLKSVGKESIGSTTPQADSNISGVSPEIISAFNNFSTLHIGYYGTTQNCKPFNIYCFKYRHTWFLIANQNMNISFFTLYPPRTESNDIVSGSPYLLQGLGKAYTNNYTKIKKRRRVVKDLEIYGFYKFNRPGRKSIKGLLYLEFPETDPGPPWPFKWIADKAQKKAAEKIKGAKGVIPEINTEAVEPAKEIVPE
jgi:hypothetical protein